MQTMSKPKNPLPCTVLGCTRLRRGGDLCEMHYYRFRRYGDFEKRGRHDKYDDDKSMEEHLMDKFLMGIRILPNGCWVCDTAVENKKTGGYSEVIIQSRNRGKFREYVHRLSFRRSKGEVPVGLEVCHSCDNPPCCNPDHLFAGTRSDNMQDMVNKGRSYRGSNNNPLKLTEDDVLEIYRLSDAGGASQYTIARQFGVNDRYIWLIVNGRRWKHLYRRHRANAPVATT